MTVPTRNTRDTVSAISAEIQEYTSKMYGQTGSKDITAFKALLKDAISSPSSMDEERIHLLLLKMRKQGH